MWIKERWTKEVDQRTGSKRREEHVEEPEHVRSSGGPEILGQDSPAKSEDGQRGRGRSLCR